MTIRQARVLLLAMTTGYQIRSFGEAAARLGVQLIFASDRCDRLDDPWWDAAIPVRFHEEDASLAAIRERLAAPPDGILAVGDRPTLLAARVAEAFGMPGNTPRAAAISRNKLATREALRDAGLLVPSFVSCPVDADPRAAARSLRYPLVVKPLALSGSRGVMRVDDDEALEAAFERLRRLLESSDIRMERDPVHRRAVIETFVPGREFAVEGVLTRGVLTVLAIFDKPDPLDGPFFEETIYVTPSREPADAQKRIASAIGAAARAIGLEHGPVHAECRVNEQGVFVLEVAARPIGGLCAKALRFANPSTAPGAGRMSLEELLLRHALGEDVSGCAREEAASAVMMIPIPARGLFRGVDGEAEARAVAGVDDVRLTAKRDTELVPLPEGRGYLGFIFAHAADAAGAEHAVRAAHARLRFTIEKALPVI